MRLFFLFFILSIVISGCTGNNENYDLDKAIKLIKAGDYSNAKKQLELLVKADGDDNSIALYYYAHSCRKTGDSSTALNILNEMVLKDSKNGSVYTELSSIYREKNEFDKAITYSLKAVDTDPSNPVFLNDLGVSYSMAGKVQEALKAYDKVLQLKPNKVITIFNSAILYLREKQYQRAELSFEKARVLKPDNLRILFFLGETKFELGKFTSAKKIYNTIVALNAPELKNKSGRIDYQLGRIYLENKSYDSAKSCFKRVLKAEYEVNRTRFYLGQTFYEDKKYKESLYYLNSIPQASARDIPELSYYMGLCLFEQKLFKESLEYLQEALMTSLPKAPVLTRMGLSYLHIQNIGDQRKELTSKVLLEKALQFFEEALTNDHNNIKAMMGVGRVYYKQHKSRKALSVLAKITRISGGYSRADLLSSLCYYDLGDLKKAKENAEKYLARHSDDSKVVMYLAQIEFEKGNFEKAGELLRKVIVLSPENWNAMILLSTLYTQQGKYIDAAEILLTIMDKAEDSGVKERAQELYDFITRPFREIIFPKRQKSGKGTLEYIVEKLKAPTKLIMSFKDDYSKQLSGKSNETIDSKKLFKDRQKEMIELTRELVVDYKYIKRNKLFKNDSDQQYYKDEIRKLIKEVKDVR